MSQSNIFLFLPSFYWEKNNKVNIHLEWVELGHEGYFCTHWERCLKMKYKWLSKKLWSPPQRSERSPAVSWWVRRLTRGRCSEAHCRPKSSPRRRQPARSTGWRFCRWRSGTRQNNRYEQGLKTANLLPEDRVWKSDSSWRARRCSWCVEQHCRLLAFTLGEWG